jgi:hypothetical protein
MVRRMCVTPTTWYCLPPEQAISNRIIRLPKCKKSTDHFLRVTFMDEDLEKISQAQGSVKGNEYCLKLTCIRDHGSLACIIRF